VVHVNDNYIIIDGLGQLVRLIDGEALTVSNGMITLHMKCENPVASVQRMQDLALTWEMEKDFNDPSEGHSDP
jgi:hypothetical protein